MQTHNNKDNCDDDDDVNIGGDDGRKDGMHILAAAEVTPHTTRTDVGAGALAQHHSKPVYWDSTESAILFGFNKGENVYAGLRQRVTLLKRAL